MTGFEIERRVSDKNNKLYVSLTGGAITDAIETLLDMAWEAAGGRGERPAGRGVLFSNHRGASVSFEAADVDQRGNVPVNLSEQNSAVARAWAAKIAAAKGAAREALVAACRQRNGKIAGFMDMIAHLTAPASQEAAMPDDDDVAAMPDDDVMPAPAPRAKAPAPVKAKTAPGPYSVAARLSAAHGVTITRKGKRAA